MARVVVQVPFNSEKLIALRTCLERREISLEDELVKKMDELYGKYAPEELKMFVEHR